MCIITDKGGTKAKRQRTVDSSPGLRLSHFITSLVCPQPVQILSPITRTSECEVGSADVSVLFTRLRQGGEIMLKTETMWHPSFIIHRRLLMIPPHSSTPTNHLRAYSESERSVRGQHSASEVQQIPPQRRVRN